MPKDGPPRGHTSTLSCVEALAAATGMLPWNNSPTAAAKAPVALAAVICRADMATNCAVVLPALGSAYQATVPVCESSMVMLHLHISSWHHAGAGSVTWGTMALQTYSLEEQSSVMMACSDSLCSWSGASSVAAASVPGRLSRMPTRLTGQAVAP